MIDYLTDNASAVSILIAMFAVLGALVGVILGTRHARLLVRYEATRSKRACAKALRAEIANLAKTPSNGHIEPVIYAAYADQIGRLTDEAIESVVSFYTRLSGEGPLEPEELKKASSLAVNDLSNLLRETEPELTDLRRKLRTKKH